MQAFVIERRVHALPVLSAINEEKYETNRVQKDPRLLVRGEKHEQRRHQDEYRAYDAAPRPTHVASVQRHHFAIKGRVR